MKIAIQIDYYNQLNLSTDTSLYIAETLKRKGYKVYFYHPKSISFDKHNEEIRAIIYDDVTLLTSRNKTKVFSSLEDYDIIMIRQNPPFNMEYLTNLHLLKYLKKPVILNPLNALLAFPEKLSTLAFPQYIPNTLVTADLRQAKDFILQHGKAVIKSLYGYGGKEVALIDNPLSASLRSFMRKHSHVILQEFLSSVVKEGDKRILMIDGKYRGAIRRVPRDKEFRANMVQGGRAEVVPITSQEQMICAEVGKLLKDNGIIFAGLDVIDSKLIEINITSPTCLKTYDELAKDNAVVQLAEAIEECLSKCRKE